MTATRQSSHILMTSRRRAEPLNIQCLPSSLAETRSIVLLTPNGLLQRMHSNGASSLRTRADTERPMLRFAEDACVQCGLCKATCPEKVITLRPPVSYTHLRAHETPEHLVCRLLL